jgi:hypothetical protein
MYGTSSGDAYRTLTGSEIRFDRLLNGLLANVNGGAEEGKMGVFFLVRNVPKGTGFDPEAVNVGFPKILGESYSTLDYVQDLIPGARVPKAVTSRLDVAAKFDSSTRASDLQNAESRITTLAVSDLNRADVKNSIIDALQKARGLKADTTPVSGAVGGGARRIAAFNPRTDSEFREQWLACTGEPFAGYLERQAQLTQFLPAPVVMNN